MSKASKRKTPIAASTAQRGTAKENPFEAQLSRKKFTVVGRNTKGARKNVNKARSEAVDRRKNTLLVEYRQLKKANAFIDRRFGEFDDTMTEDEKAIARFQKARMQKARKNKFALSEPESDQAETLTHLGNPLSALDDFKDAMPEAIDDDADLEGQLDAEMVQALHFGSGVGNGQAKGEHGQRKTKQEVMAELMAKSKLAKAEKRQQKEEDEDLIEDLDKKFAAIQEGGTLAKLRREIGASKGERQKADNDDDAAYDVTRREMVFEGRGQATDRQATAEELLEREQERLAKLEKARLKRLKGDAAEDDDACEGEEAEAALGGYAKRRALARKQMEAEAAVAARKASLGASAEAEDDFALDDDDDPLDDEDVAGVDDDGGDAAGVSRLDARRMARAAGSHPLQQEFRAMTAELLLKHGVQPSKQSMADLEERDGSDDDTESSDDADSDAGLQEQGKNGRAGESSDEEEYSEDEEVDEENGARDPEARTASALDGVDVADAVSGSDEEEESVESDEEGLNSEEEENALALLQKAIALKGGKVEAADEGDSDGDEARSGDDDDEDSDDGNGLRASTSTGKRAAAASADVSMHPTKRKKLDARAAAQSDAAATTSASAADAGLSVSYTPALPRTYAEFRAMAEDLSGPDVVVLVQRLRAYHAKALTAGVKTGLQALYGVLLQHYTMLAGERPLRRGVLEAMVPVLVTMTAEVPLYAATLARARLAAMHALFSESLKSRQGIKSGWPGTRGLILMHLFTVLFPMSDRKHPVCTPLSLLIGYLVALCPLRQPRDVGTGLFLCALLQHMAAAGGRYAPEVTPFCEALLHSAVKPSRRVDESTLCSGHMQIGRGWLNGAAVDGHEAFTPLSSRDFLSRDAKDAHFDSAAFRSCAYSTTLQLIRGQLRSLQSNEGLEAAMRPLQRALARVIEHGDVSEALRAETKTLSKEVQAACAACVAARKPLVCEPLARKRPQKLLNPKFEMGFDKQRDYDHDRERADYKQYKRMAAKERRATQREMARDAAFIGEVKRRDKVRKQNALDKTQKKAIAFLEQQQADFKSGGQGGMNPHKKKRKT